MERGETAPAATVAEPQASPSAPPAFVLAGVVLKGVTAFPLKEFAPLYDKYLATKVSTTEMAAIAQRITEKYRRAGYFLSRAIVPAQSVQSGILQIEVQEGYISDLDIRAPAGWHISRYFDAVRRERPLRLRTLDRALALIGDLKGARITKNTLEPIFDEPSAHKLVIAVEVDRTSAYLYADNRGNDAVGPLEAYASASLNSLLSAGDQISVGAFTVPDQPRELLYGEVAYALPLGRGGTYLSAHASASRIKAGAPLAVLDYKVDSQKAVVDLSHPLVRTRRLGLWAKLAVSANDVKEFQLGARQYRDAIRTVSASLNFYREHGNGVSRAFLEVSHGLPIAGASRADGADPVSRPGADITFTKVYGQISRYQSIGRVFGLYVAAKGQYAADTLLASEEIPLGGPDFGRAYDYWTVSGEKGVAGQAELRFGKNPGPQWLDFIQLYAFYDIGAVWNERLAADFRELSLSSAGAGLRLTFADDLQASYEFALPVDTPFSGMRMAGRHFFYLSWNL